MIMKSNRESSLHIVELNSSSSVAHDTIDHMWMFHEFLLKFLYFSTCVSSFLSLQLHWLIFWFFLSIKIWCFLSISCQGFHSTCKKSNYCWHQRWLDSCWFFFRFSLIYDKKINHLSIKNYVNYRDEFVHAVILFVYSVFKCIYVLSRL